MSVKLKNVVYFEIQDQNGEVLATEYSIKSALAIRDCDPRLIILRKRIPATAENLLPMAVWMITDGMPVVKAWKKIKQTYAVNGEELRELLEKWELEWVNQKKENTLKILSECY